MAHVTKGIFPSWLVDKLVWFFMGWDAMKGLQGRAPINKPAASSNGSA